MLFRSHKVQVLGNYIDNAIKFSDPDKKATLTVGGLEDSDSWTLWVKDNGIGFDPVYAQRIFAIFQRLLLTAHMEPFDDRHNGATS